MAEEMMNDEESEGMEHITGRIAKNKNAADKLEKESKTF